MNIKHVFMVSALFIVGLSSSLSRAMEQPTEAQMYNVTIKNNTNKTLYFEHAPWIFSARDPKSARSLQELVPGETITAQVHSAERYPFTVFSTQDRKGPSYEWDGIPDVENNCAIEIYQQDGSNTLSAMMRLPDGDTLVVGDAVVKVNK